jgi:hypothetical protein
LGLEATCTARLGAAASRGRALLETGELIFRGDFRVRIAFGDIHAVDATGGRLLVRWRGGEPLALELGAAAPRWADKIRNPPSRLDKLGVKPGARVAVVGARDAGGLDQAFLGELGARGTEVWSGTPRVPVDLIFYAPRRRDDLARLAALARLIVPDGALWVLRPKGSAAAAAATVSEGDVLVAGRQAGLVDTKVVAFSPSHSAAKLMIPVAKRAKPATTTATTTATPSRATARSRPPGRSRSDRGRIPRPPAPARGRPG